MRAAFKLIQHCQCRICTIFDPIIKRRKIYFFTIATLDKSLSAKVNNLLRQSVQTVSIYICGFDSAYKLAAQFYRIISVVVKRMVIIYKFRKLLCFIKQADMKCRNCHCIAYRLTAGAAEFYCSSESKILGFECTQICYILGLRMKFHRAYFAVFEIFSNKRFRIEILKKIYGLEIQILSVSFNTVNGGG